MSQQRGRRDAGDAVRELQAGPGRVKRRKTRGERNRAKFGPSLSGTGWRGGRHPWGGLPPPRAAPPPQSPLPPPRPVIITQQRLCRSRGLLGRGVASVDIKRLLEGGQGAQPPPPPPAEEVTVPPETPRPVRGMEREGQRSPSPPKNPPEKVVGDRDSPNTVTSARGLAARLCALLPHPPEFFGRMLAEERRRELLAVLLKHHHTLPDLATLFPHKSVGAAGGFSHAQHSVPPPASNPAPGLSTAEAELLPQPMQSRGPASRHSHPSTPPQAIPQSPTSPPQLSPVFSAEMKRQSWFPWMSEDEDDAHPENPAPQFWVQTPPPPFRPTPPACSPISHPPVRHCTPEPELPPQQRRRRDPAPHYCRCRASLQAVAQTPSPRAVLPPPVFGARRRERQSWFPLMSEDEDDAHPENSAPLFWVRTPSPPLFSARTPRRIPLREPGCTCGAAWDPRAEDTANGHGEIHQQSRVPRCHRVSQHPLAGQQPPPQPHQCHGNRQRLSALHRGSCRCASSPPHHPHKRSPCPHSWPHPTSDLPMYHRMPPTSYRPQGCRVPMEPRRRGWHLSCCPHSSAPRRAGDGDSSPNAWLFPCMY